PLTEEKAAPTFGKSCGRPEVLLEMPVTTGSSAPAENKVVSDPAMPDASSCDVFSPPELFPSEEAVGSTAVDSASSFTCAVTAATSIFAIGISFSTAIVNL